MLEYPVTTNFVGRLAETCQFRLRHKEGCGGGLGKTARVDDEGGRVCLLAKPAPALVKGNECAEKTAG